MSYVTDEFMSQYGREFSFYRDVSENYIAVLRQKLETAGIKAIVSGRAKDHGSLRKKLAARNVEKKYPDVETIRGDLRDLAGVRIALYFPDDLAEVAKLITQNFEVTSTKRFPEKSRRPAGKENDGYHAEHFQIQCKPTDFSPEQTFLPSATLEIQVASLLMHAFSEVEHDMEYKAQAKISAEESSALDRLNGVVLKGEEILRELKSAQKERLRREKVIEDQYDLLAVLPSLVDMFTLDVELGDLQSLSDLLVRSKRNSPDQVYRLVSDLVGQKPEYDVAETLSFLFLFRNPEMRPPHGELSTLERLWNAALPHLKNMLEVAGISDTQLAVNNSAVLSKLPVSREAKSALAAARKLLRPGFLKNELVSPTRWGRMPEIIDDVVAGLQEVAGNDEYKARRKALEY